MKMHNLLGQLDGAPVLLGVSGGIDSMVMLDIFIRNYKGPFDVATISHGIRPESLSDCYFVKDYCDRHGVNCDVLAVDVPLYAEENRLSIETAARILRRHALLDCAEGRIICLAHNACDQAESVLMHLLRGSGAQGGTGMRPLADGIFRPLLCLTREQIESYAKEQAVPHVSDSTNSDDSYSRNYLRNRIMPQFAKINSNAVGNICAFADKLAADEQVFENIIEVTYAKTPPLIERDYAEIPLCLLGLHPSIAGRIVLDVFERMGYPVDLENKHVSAVISLAQKQTGRKIDLPFNLMATRAYSCVTIEKKETVLPIEADEVPFKTVETVCFGRKVYIGTSVGGLKFAAEKVPEDAVWRRKKSRDTFEKFGGGTKKLKEYLIDIKVPQKDRADLILLASGSRVLAILGVGISEALRVTDGSTVMYMRYADSREKD